MAQTIGNGGNALALTIPTRADNSWDAVMQAALQAVSAHTHDGLQNGAAVTLASQSITNSKLATMNSSSSTVGTVKGNISGVPASPSDLSLTVLGVANSVPIRDSSGILQAKGVIDGSNATTGYLGEQSGPISRLKSAAVALTTNTPAPVALTVTSITLSAGDWEVRGALGFIPAATTSITQLVGAVRLSVSNSLPAADTRAVPTSGEVTIVDSRAAFVPGANDITMQISPYRVSTFSSITLFLVAQATFTVNTLSVYGSLDAIRIR